MLNLILIIGFYLLVSGLRPFYCPVELRFCVRSYSDISVRFSPIFADKVTIDKNLYQIRVDINDFKISLFSQVELGIKTNKKATTATFSSTSSDIDYKKKNIDSHDEILESYKKKLENGLKAEILLLS